MTDLQRALCRDIFDHYGSNMQMDVMQEECAELIQAISKIKRKGFRASTFDNLIEELADVEIMIEQMKYMLKDDLEAAIKVKLERQRDRIEKEIEERRIEHELRKREAERD